jgi:hypothetical protein
MQGQLAERFPRLHEQGQGRKAPQNACMSSEGVNVNHYKACSKAIHFQTRSRFDVHVHEVRVFVCITCTRLEDTEDKAVSFKVLPSCAVDPGDMRAARLDPAGC